MFNKYWAVTRISLLSRFAFWGDQLLASAFLVIILFVSKQLWVTTLASQGASALSGYDLNQILWYVLATEIIVMSLPRIHATLSNEVKNGDIAVRLKQPFHYIYFHFFSALGEALARSVFVIAIGSATVFLLVGAYPGTWGALLGGALALLVAVLVNIVYALLIGITAFWTEDVSGAFLLLDRAKWILGGMMLPLDLYPEAMKPWIKVLPFRYMFYDPARLFLSFDSWRFVETLLWQVFWGGVLLGILHSLYTIGIKRVSVHGG